MGGGERKATTSRGVRGGTIFLPKKSVRGMPWDYSRKGKEKWCFKSRQKIGKERFALSAVENAVHFYSRDGGK